MRVLVGSDLSNASDAALREAASLAKESGDLAVVHVLPLLAPMSPLLSQQGPSDAMTVGDTVARTKELVREQMETVAGRSGTVFIEEGPPYAEIIRRAEAWGADVVVLGSHRPTGFHRIFGSVAERVARHAPCHVLVVREGTHAGPVIAATDLSHASLPAVSVAALEAKRRHRELRIVHAMGFIALEANYLLTPAASLAAGPTAEDDQLRARLTTAVKRAGVQGRCEILDGDAGRAIIANAEAVDAELVVVASHDHPGLTRLALGSVTGKVVRSASCDVLVVRRGKSWSAADRASATELADVVHRAAQTRGHAHRS